MALISKVLPKTYPELCAVYLPRAIADEVALSKALEAINALKGCKHLNPDQKQISTIFRIGSIATSATCRMGAAPGK